jgi:hypothetical protein
VALASSGLAIIDISKPGAPDLLSIFPTAGIALDVAGASSVAYVAAHEAGLVIVDLSDPGTPEVAAELDLGSPAWGVAMSGALAYLATDGGLSIVDVGRADAPIVIADLSLSEARDVAVAGGRAYLVGSSGFRIIDVSNPRLPFPLGALETSEAHKVLVHGQHAYVADGRVGFQVIDVTDPNAPLLVGGADTPSEARAVTLSDNGVVIADGTCSDTECWGGIYLYPFQCVSGTLGTGSLASTDVVPGRPSAWPNPFTLGGAAELHFELPRAGRARVDIFDVSGRLVRNLCEGHLAGGGHVFRWDGRDALGRLVGAGVYFSRLGGHGFEMTARLTVVR